MNTKSVKKKAVKDTGMAELLALLKARPHLVHALVVDHGKVKQLLKSNEARRLIPGVGARKILENRVVKSHHGGSVGVILGCLRRSR